MHFHLKFSDLVQNSALAFKLPALKVLAKIQKSVSVTNFQFEASWLIEIVQPRAFVPVWERTPWATEQRGLLEVSTEQLLEASVELLKTPASGVGELNGLSKFQLPM